MTKFWRLLMASTVLSGLAGLGSAHAGNIPDLPASIDATQPIVLAQATTPDDKTKKQQRQEQRQQQRQDNRQNNKQNTQASPPPPPAATRSNNNNSGNANNNRDGNRGNANNNRDNNRGNANNNNRNNNSNANNNRNNNANSGTTNAKPTTAPVSPPPPPPVTNTQNTNDNKGNAGNNNRGNANNNRDNNRGNANNNNRDGNRGNANNNRDNNRGNANNNNQNNQGNADNNNRNGNANNTSRNNNSGNAEPIASGGKGKGVTVQTSTGKTVNNVSDVKADRTVVKEGNKTIIKEPGRTIVKEGNKTIIRHDEANRFRVGAVNVTVQKAGADNRTIIVRPGGQKVVTLTDRNGFLLRRSIILPNGREVILINNRPRAGNFFIVLPPPRIRIPRDHYIVAYRDAPPALIYDTLMAPPVDNIERAYSLDEIRYSPTLRDRMPRIDIDSVTFDSGSWDLAPEQIDKLGPIADAMKRGIEQNPQVVFLVEGYTDAVGNEDDNLSLSDRRAETVAVALTEQFGVPAENLSTQGYGEQDLKVPTDGPEEANRRVTIRNIAPLLAGRNGPAQGEPMPQ